MAHEPDRVDPVTDPVVRVAVLTIIDDELNQSAPELAEDLEHRVDYPEQYGGEAIARIPEGWVIDWRDAARLVLQQIEREDPALVERLEQPDPDMRRFQGRPWPAAARRFRLTRAGEKHSIWIYDTHFAGCPRVAVITIMDLVTRKWICEIVSGEETSTQVQVAFCDALELEGLHELVAERQDSLTDPLDDAGGVDWGGSPKDR